MKFILGNKTRRESQAKSVVLLQKHLIIPLWAVLVNNFLAITHTIYIQFSWMHNCKKFIIFTSEKNNQVIQVYSFRMSECAPKHLPDPAASWQLYHQVTRWQLDWPLQVIFWLDRHPRGLAITLIHTFSHQRWSPDHRSDWPVVFLAPRKTNLTVRAK